MRPNQFTQFVAADVETKYPVWSPHEAFDGAATLLRVLEQEKAAP